MYEYTTVNKSDYSKAETSSNNSDTVQSTGEFGAPASRKCLINGVIKTTAVADVSRRSVSVSGQQKARVAKSTSWTLASPGEWAPTDPATRSPPAVALRKRK